MVYEVETLLFQVMNMESHCSSFSLFATALSYENEEQLRNRGTSRTPDVLLSSPLGIQVMKKDGSGMEWKMITWIDSKVGMHFLRFGCCFCCLKLFTFYAAGSIW